MMQVMKIFAVATILSSWWLTPVVAQSLDDIRQRGELSIGMLVDFPPFGFLDPQGNASGYDADVAQQLAESLGVKAKIVPVTGPNRIPYLLSKKVDVLVASLGKTPERAAQVDFSQPYAGIEIYVYGEKELKVQAPKDLVGKSIGVARASTQDQSVTAIAPEGADVRRFDDDSTAVQALISGQVPLIGSSNTLSAQIEKVAPGRFDRKFDLRKQVQGIVTRPKQVELMAAINAFLSKEKASGKLNELHLKWVGNPLPDFISSDLQ